jgi:hypothetical protein
MHQVFHGQNTAFYDFIPCAKVDNGILQETIYCVQCYFGNADGHANVHVKELRMALSILGNVPEVFLNTI